MFFNACNFLIRVACFSKCGAHQGSTETLNLYGNELIKIREELFSI